jgi:hypothetical protein
VLGVILEAFSFALIFSYGAFLLINKSVICFAALCKLMDATITPQQIFEKMQPAFSHKNGKVKLLDPTTFNLSIIKSFSMIHHN